MSKIKQAVVVIFFVILAIIIAYGLFLVVMYEPPYLTKVPRIITHEIKDFESPYDVEVDIRLDDSTRHSFDDVQSVDIITKGTLRVVTKESRFANLEFETFNVTKVRFRFKKNGYLVEFTDISEREHFISTNDAWFYHHETPLILRITESDGYSTKTFYNVEYFRFYVRD